MSKNFKRAYRAEIFSPLLKIDFFNSIVGLLTAAWAVLDKPAAAQPTEPLAGKDSTPYSGVVVRAYGESPANALPVDVALRAVLVGNPEQIEIPVLLLGYENAGRFWS